MNNFDEPVKKAETDAEILDALQGVKLTQDEIRRGACGGMGLAFFRAYYEKLPEEVARRLTEIDTEAVGHITRATGLNLSGSLLDRFGEKLASDAAFAQVIRAANVYRGRLGYAPPRAGRLAGARGGRTMKNPFRCSDCEHMGLMGRARLTSGTSWGGPRGECWCKHPEAEASFAASGNRSASCFIAFTAPGGSTPAIKTSPRWCPLKRPGATRSPGKGPSAG